MHSYGVSWSCEFSWEGSNRDRIIFVCFHILGQKNRGFASRYTCIYIVYNPWARSKMGYTAERPGDEAVLKRGGGVSCHLVAMELVYIFLPIGKRDCYSRYIYTYTDIVNIYYMGTKGVFIIAVNACTCGAVGQSSLHQLRISGPMDGSWLAVGQHLRRRFFEATGLGFTPTGAGGELQAAIPCMCTCSSRIGRTDLVAGGLFGFGS